MKLFSSILVISFVLGIIALIFHAQQEKSNELISCPSYPQNHLESNQLKIVHFSNIPSLLAQQVKPDQDIGYIFSASARDRFNYSKLGDICIWLFTPDNKIVDSSVLPVTGKYIMQISSARGTVNFEINTTLEKDSTIAQKIKKNMLKISSIKPKLNDQNIYENLVNEHLSKLNTQDYKKAWSDLSPRFQKKLKNDLAYSKIWQKYIGARLINMVVLSKTDKEVIVAIEINYLSFEDAIGTIIFTFDPKYSKWLIEYVSI